MSSAPGAALTGRVGLRIDPDAPHALKVWRSDEAIRALKGRPAPMARMLAIVSRLASIEELAGMDILCSDKTGTSTKNEITLGAPIAIAGNLACELVSPDVIDVAILKGATQPAALADCQGR